MYKKIRKSLADTIASVDDPELFEWKKWLREPQIYLERFPKPQTNVKSVESFNTFEEPTLYQVQKFRLTKFKISDSIKNCIIKKKKTFQVFFNVSKTANRKIDLFTESEGKILFKLNAVENENKNILNIIHTSVSQVISFASLSNKVDIKVMEPEVTQKLALNSEVKEFKENFQIHKPILYNKKFGAISASNGKGYFKNNFLNEPKTKCVTVKLKRIDQRPALKKFEILNFDQVKEKLLSSDRADIQSWVLNEMKETSKNYKIKFKMLEDKEVSTSDIKNISVKVPNHSQINIDEIEYKREVMKYNLSEILPEEELSNEEISILEIPEAMASIEEQAKIQSNQAEIEKKVQPEPIPEKKKITSINWNKVETDFKALRAYQKDGVKLFLKNKSAILCDELGINKKIQAIYALNSALKHRFITNALIVCPRSNIGDISISEHSVNSDGWKNQIYEFNHLSELDPSSKSGKSHILDAFENEEVKIIDYKNFIDTISDPSNASLYDNIECLILDEAQYLVNNDIQVDTLFNFPACKFNWILTSLPLQLMEELLIPKLQNHVAGIGKIDGYLNRTRQSLGETLPSIVRTNYWLDLDAEQIEEYKNVLSQGRSRLSSLVKGGNIFIIQSNIFTLIHQIKQLSNFSVSKESSLKSELLMDQLESIIASGQKCIIFSQYDKQGVQKIERLLKNNRIKYVLYQSGMPLKELENSANAFSKEPRISVMLAGLTAASIKVKIPEAAYLIHFDQWWNPINQWQYEESLAPTGDINKAHESINVINYFGNNEIEIKIRETLYKKGLLYKSLFEYLSNETIYSLISNEEWLDIFGIEYFRTRKNLPFNKEEVMQKWSNATLTEIGQKTKLLFTKLGYKNLLLKPDPINEEISIYGMGSKAFVETKISILCLPFTMDNVEPVQNFIQQATKNKNRMFVVCSDELAKKFVSDPFERITFIGQELFINYLSQFKVD